MDYDKLKQKKEQLEQAKPSIPLAKILQKQRQFEVEYAHNSTALAGNSLTLEQTRTVLDLSLIHISAPPPSRGCLFSSSGTAVIPASQTMWELWSGLKMAGSTP